MTDTTEDINPAFFTWAEENGINLEHKEDWEEWLNCWVDGYTNGVNDIKKIMQGK